jgi:hypothetical protein
MAGRIRENTTDKRGQAHSGEILRTTTRIIQAVYRRNCSKTPYHCKTDVNKKGLNMDNLNYKQAYYFLFNKITDLITVFEKKNISSVIDVLKKIQVTAEEIAISDRNIKQLELDIEQTLIKLADKIKYDSEK